MSPSPSSIPLEYRESTPDNNGDRVLAWAARRAAAPSVNAGNRAAINRANSQHSTGPRTPAGKHRSSQNARRHGLTARSPITSESLAPKDEPLYQQLCHKFFDEYQPATATEAQMVQFLADTSWRLDRIPQLEDTVLGDTSLASQEAIDQIARLGLYTARLSRQFQNTVRQLHQLQDDRRRHERAELRNAADLLFQHEKQGKSWDPIDDGFVFSRQKVEQFAIREMRLNTARIFSCAAFELSPKLAGVNLRRLGIRPPAA